jgi:AcrR family transcriptional regulator
MQTRRQRNRDEQRQRILDSARFLFGARSFEDVTMADIAALAGVARATVFNHFASKHQLVEAITGDVLAFWASMLEHALGDEDTPTPALVRALFSQMGAGIEQYYRFYRGVFRELAKLQQGIDERSAVVRVRATSLERLTALLARGQARGELRADVVAADLASAFDSLANGTISQWLFENTSGSLRERMERVAEIYLGPVAIGANAARAATVVELPAPPHSLRAPTRRPPARRRRT